MVILMKNDKKKVKTKLRQQDIKKYSKTEIDHVILKIKEKELQYTILCVSIIVFIVLVSGYVIFSAIQNTSSNNTLRNGNLLIDYKDTKYGFGDVVTMREIKPLSDDRGKKLNNYQIKVSNKTIKDINYVVKLAYDQEMMELDECSDRYLALSNIKYSINNSDALVLENEKEEIIYKGKVRAHNEDVLNISIWVSDTYKEDLNKHFHGKFIIEETRETTPSLESVGEK